MRTSLPRLFAILSLCLILAACAAPAAQAPTATPLPPTATPLPPTATPLPPTATPLPTATPPPTATPLPPTATPLPERPEVADNWIYLHDQGCDGSFENAFDVSFKPDGSAESYHYFGLGTEWSEDGDNLTVRLFNDGEPLRFTRAGRSFTGEFNGFCLELRPRFAGVSMPSGRTFHASFTLADGSILVLGGQVATTAQGEFAPAGAVLRYDPATALWRTIADLDESRLGAAMAQLDDGRVLLVGGGPSAEDEAGFVPVERRVLILDPISGATTPAADIGYPITFAAATLLDDGRVLVSGGNASVDEQTIAYDVPRIYDPASDSWADAAAMPVSKVNHRAVRLGDGRVLIPGGLDWDGTVYNNSALTLLYDPAADRWAQAGDLAYPRQYYSVVLLEDGRVAVNGGFSNEARGVTAPSEIFDPATGAWAEIGAPPGAHFGPSAALLLPDGAMLLIGGGYYYQGASRDVSRYDPAANTWEALAPLALPRSLHTLTLLPDGALLVVGGSLESQGTPALVEIYDPRGGGGSTLLP